MKKTELVEYIDHTVLAPDNTIKEIKKACNEALKYNFKGVCVHPCFVKNTAELLATSRVKTISVAGFPLGTNTTEIKLNEVKKALTDGAGEIDVVANIGAIKEKNWDYLKEEIASLIKITREVSAILKVIIETGYLTEEEKKTIGNLCIDKGVDYLKTCTGFGPGQATVHDISLLKKLGGEDINIKASGKIRSYNEAINLISSGADRIGASRSIDIIEGH